MNSKEERYNKIMNEGGEGYNPYCDTPAGDPGPSCPEDTMDRVRRELSRIDCVDGRECGTYDAVKVAELQTILAELEQAEEDCFAAQWPRHITTARRLAWNAWVKSVRHLPNQDLLRALVAHEQKVCYTREDLKRAERIHAQD